MANILVCSMYKSGSNHIADSLANLLGCHRTFLSAPGEGYAQDAQRLDPISMAALFNRLDGMVYLQHILGTRANVSLIKYFGAYTIVTMRKLFPALHSLRRYEELLIKDGRKDDKYINKDWPNWSDEDKWRWLAYNAIPWYYQHYVSWGSADIPKHIVWFEKHFENQVASAERMCDFLGVTAKYSDIEKAFLHKNSNYTSDRTEYPMPDFVRDIAYDQARGWGLWETPIRRQLLDD